MIVHHRDLQRVIAAHYGQDQKVEFFLQWRKLLDEDKPPMAWDATAWCKDRMGDPAIQEQVSMFEFEFNPNARWAVLGNTYYFKDDGDAMLFKMFFTGSNE